MQKITEKFNSHRSKASDINEHLITLFELSQECSHITEMGVRWVSSTWAFVNAKPNKIISYDIVTNPNINEVIDLCKEYSINYAFEERDVLKLEIEPTEFLFIDTLHTYTQLTEELKLHSSKVSKYIALHDTEHFGRSDENIYDHASDVVKTKKSEKQGLMTAVEDFLTTDLGQSWEIHKIYKNNNGLTVLKNRNYQK